MNQELYWIWLSQKLSFGGLAFKKILTAFSTPEQFYKASEEDWKPLHLFPGELSRLQEKSLQEAETIFSQCRQRNIQIVTPLDERYPDRLYQLENPPVLLYVQGSLPNVDETLSLAVIGARRASAYGTSHARKIAFTLAEAGAVIVSGGARGVDSAGLEGALEAGGRTIAVLGGGVDVNYPPSFSSLRRKIIDCNGAVVSEYPPGSRPYAGNFPVRNRIIAGLSAGLVVTEASLKSGSLITARLALEQNRDVFAMPGSIDSDLSRGTNGLIQAGAKAVTCGEDILEEYAYTYLLKPLKGRLKKQLSEAPKQQPENMPFDSSMFSQNAKALYQQLTIEPQHLDVLAAKAGLSPGATSAAVTELELLEAIRSYPGKRYSLPGIIQQ